MEIFPESCRREELSQTSGIGRSNIYVKKTKKGSGEVP
jgi:hypothetical protein